MFSIRFTYSYPDDANSRLNEPDSGKSKKNQIASIGIKSNVATVTRKFRRNPAFAGNFRLKSCMCVES